MDNSTYGIHSSAWRVTPPSTDDPRMRGSSTERSSLASPHGRVPLDANQGERVTRSFPEKTFEHWCSIHLTYRYRAKLLMWWPANTADIDIVNPNSSWGKRFWLELKTTEWKPGTPGHHSLSIDLPQLAAYALQPVPDYYVFPVPPWQGELGGVESRLWLAGARERLAYESWSGEQWFARWTRVVPGWFLRKQLHAELAALGPNVKKKSHRIATVANGVLQPVGPALANAPLKYWRDFWEHQEACGDDEWPAQYVLRAGSVPASSTGVYNRATLAGELRRLRDGAQRPTLAGKIDVYDWNGDGYELSKNVARYDDFRWDEGQRSLQMLTDQAIRD